MLQEVLIPLQLLLREGVRKARHERGWPAMIFVVGLVAALAVYVALNLRERRTSGAGDPFPLLVVGLWTALYGFAFLTGLHPIQRPPLDWLTWVPTKFRRSYLLGWAAGCLSWPVGVGLVAWWVALPQPSAAAGAVVVLGWLLLLLLSAVPATCLRLALFEGSSLGGADRLLGLLAGLLPAAAAGFAETDQTGAFFLEETAQLLGGPLGMVRFRRGRAGRPLPGCRRSPPVAAGNLRRRRYRPKFPEHLLSRTLARPPGPAVGSALDLPAEPPANPVRPVDSARWFPLSLLLASLRPARSSRVDRGGLYGDGPAATKRAPGEPPRHGTPGHLALCAVGTLGRGADSGQEQCSDPTARFHDPGCRTAGPATVHHPGG